MKSQILANIHLPLMLATLPDSKKELEVALYENEQDGSRLLVNKMANPFSPFGNDKAKMKLVATDKTVPISAEKMADFLLVGQCEHCQSEIRASAEMVELFTGEDFNCLVCSEKLHGVDIPSPDITERKEKELAELAENPAEIDSFAEGEEIPEADEEAYPDGDEYPEDDVNYEEFPEDEDFDDEITAADQNVLAIEDESPASQAEEAGKPVMDYPEYCDPEDTKCYQDFPEDEDRVEKEHGEGKEEALANLELDEYWQEQARKYQPQAEMEPVPGGQTTPTQNYPLPPSYPFEEDLDKFEKPVHPGDKGDHSMTGPYPEGSDTPSGDIREKMAETDHPPVVLSPQSGGQSQSTYPLTSGITWPSCKLDLVRIGQDNHCYYYVFADQQPVAKLDQAKAHEELANIWSTESLVKAFKVEAGLGMSVEAQQRFGLVPITLEITPDEALQRQYQEKANLAQAEFARQLQEFKADYQQAIATAVMASIKGIWNIANPLREGLLASLEQNGVKKPEQIVDANLAKHSLDFFRNILTEASQISAKPLETRNDLARMVETATFRHHTPHASLNETLASGSIPVNLVETEKPKLTVVATETKDRQADLRARLRLGQR